MIFLSTSVFHFVHILKQFYLSKLCSDLQFELFHNGLCCLHGICFFEFFDGRSCMYLVILVNEMC